MSNLDTNSTLDGRSTSIANLEDSLLTASGTGFIGKTKDWLLECCSSILVKEGRQALKSFQFLGTYSVLIISSIV